MAVSAGVESEVSLCSPKQIIPKGFVRPKFDYVFTFLHCSTVTLIVKYIFGNVKI